MQILYICKRRIVLEICRKSLKMNGVGESCSQMEKVMPGGVCAMFKREFDIDVSEIKKDCEGRWLDITANYANLKLRLFNVYGPNDDQPDFYAEIYGSLQMAQEDHVVLGVILISS